MANFIATTASNGPCLKDPEAAQTILDRYFWDGDVQAVVETNLQDGKPFLAIFGYDWPGAWKIPGDVIPEEFEPDYDIDPGDGFADFLREIVPCLAEPLTVHAVGAEKYRFPLSACEWHIKPGTAEVEVSGFKHCDN